jgi:hypothetical protein
MIVNHLRPGYLGSFSQGARSRVSILSELLSLLQEYNAINMSVYALRRVSVEVGDIIIKEASGVPDPFSVRPVKCEPPLLNEKLTLSLAENGRRDYTA